MDFLMRTEKGFDTFSNWLLQEAFLPKKVDFNLTKTDSGLAGIFTVKDKEYVAVLLNRSSSKVEVAFSDMANIDGLVNVQNGDSLATNAGVPFSVLNSVFYVVIELLKESNPKTVYFTGFNKSLDRLYSKMVQSKSFLKAMESTGYTYTGENKNRFTFTKESI